MTSKLQLHGGKFGSDGCALPFAGNSFICRLTPSSDPAFFCSMQQLVDGLASLGLVRELALLPSSSFHMTIRSGLVDAQRTPLAWPAGLSATASIEEGHEFVASRLRGAPFEARPVSVELDPHRPLVWENLLKVRVRPSAPREAEMICGLRREIAARLGLAPDRVQPDLHITLGYTLGVPTPTSMRQFNELRDCWLAGLENQRVELDPPELCAFEDMRTYRRLLILGEAECR